MSRKEYRHMRNDDRTALRKLVRHCGIKLHDAITLQKENFDLDQKTILFKPRKQTGTRITTIRPNDVEWFRVWLQVPLEKPDPRVIILDRLFPFSIRTVYYHIHKITKSPYLLRKELWKEMRLLGAEDSMIAIKMGHFTGIDAELDKNKLFTKLQEFEKEHFGGKK